MKVLKKALALFPAAFLLGMLLCMQVYACTAVYVGPEASADGTVIVARSNDNQCVWANYMDIVERVENKPGRTMAVDNGGTVFAPIPETTFRYTATPWMDSARAINGLQRDGAVCANEYGVSMSMAVTAFAGDAALEADPHVKNGITECTANELVICQSRTAREAVDVLCSLIDTYGSSETNIALISDQKETWYVEMYTGHQYAAVKLPADKVSVFGNEFSLVRLSEYEESLTSKDLVSLAEEKGFAVFFEDGEFDLMSSYSYPFLGYSHMRTWIGHRLLAPSVYSDDYQPEKIYPLTFCADGKVSLTDVFAILRNRYEGTEYDPDDTGRTDMRVIGTDTAMSVHVIQTFPELPADMSVVTWESSAPAAFGVFVPFANCCTEVSSAYGANQPAEQAGIFDTENYAYYLFKDLNTLCVTNAKTYGLKLREYWAEAEEKMSEGMRDVLKNAAEKRDGSGKDAAIGSVTGYCVAMQDAAFCDGKRMLNDLKWLMAQNSNTMRKGRDPETHELLAEDKPLTPFEPQGDLSVYGVVTETSTETSVTETSVTEKGRNITWMIALSVIPVAAAVLFLLLYKRKKK